MYYVKLEFFFSIAVVFLLNQIIIVDAIDIINGDYQDSTSENLRYSRQSDQRCQIPGNPPHTKYKLIGETAYNYGPGDYAQNYNLLEISCESEYKINSIFQNISNCINGKWIPPLPNCLRACSSLMSVISTRVNCKWNDPDGNDPDGNDIPLHNCLNPVEGTTVYLSCNPFFEEASILKNPVRVCREGRWDPSIPLCYPICGLKRPKAMLNIINGSNTMPGDYPWQVGIYNTQKDLICGGSILDYRVIVSAAHCFTDHDGNVNPKENYAVAAGKYYRKYDDDRDKYSQYSSILKIHVPSRYKGVINQQGYDIAILILEDPFIISLHVQPVCIELNEESPDLHLSLNKNGIVTGWGYTQSGRELAEELQEVIIPYVPFGECFKTVPNNFRRYITHDSICGGYVNLSTSVCAGDSGGGLIFQKLNADRHYIKGIVSVSPATDEGVCNSNQISVFTSIAKHTDFVRKHLAFNQKRQNIECTQDECLNNKPVNTSVEICNGNSRFDCKNFKKNCTLPHFPPNGKFILNQSKSYEPGAAVESNSILSLICDIGYVKFENAGCENSSYCSDTGEWIPTQTNENCSTCTPNDDQSCLTPNREVGTCTKVRSCTAIVNALQTPSPQAIRFARQSRAPHCGTSEIFVCCGSSGMFTTTEVYQHRLLPTPKECGIENSSPKIHYGEAAKLREFPWTALLGFILDGEDEVIFACGGSLINNRYVLTAAHCLQSTLRSLVTVRLGEYDSSTTEDCVIDDGLNDCNPAAEDFKVESIVKHPNYTYKHKANDIALVRLNRNVEFKAHIQPICLPTATAPPQMIGSTVKVAGWGETEIGTKSSVQLKANLTIISLEECANKFSGQAILTDTQYCALGFCEKKGKECADTCKGDSGGPSIRSIKLPTTVQWIQEGITSFGVQICGQGYPAVYTQVSKYVQWIVDNMRE